VLNSSLNLAQFWDGRAADLKEQAGGPIANPGEMAASHTLAIDVLESIPEYRQELHRGGERQDRRLPQDTDGRSAQVPDADPAAVDGQDAAAEAFRLIRRNVPERKPGSGRALRLPDYLGQ
jgi:hypothetical protein